MSLVLTLPAHSHFQCTHTPLIVLTVSITPSVVLSPSSQMPLCGLVVLMVSIVRGIVSSRTSHTPLRGLIVLVELGRHSTGHG